MSAAFKKHIEKFITIDEIDFDAVMDFFTLETVPKKTNLLKAGQICRANYFVLEGCLRKFFINDKGTEQTTEFALENWWLSDYRAYEQQSVSEFYIQTVEDSTLLCIHHAAQEKMLAAFPRMERYFRMVHQRAHAAMQMRIKFLYDFSREESYHHFNSMFPEFVQRIPQYLLASYLGFTPEYLSMIRKKKLS